MFHNMAPSPYQPPPLWFCLPGLQAPRLLLFVWTAHPGKQGGAPATEQGLELLCTLKGVGALSFLFTQTHSSNLTLAAVTPDIPARHRHPLELQGWGRG